MAISNSFFNIACYGLSFNPLPVPCTCTCYLCHSINFDNISITPLHMHHDFVHCAYGLQKYWTCSVGIYNRMENIIFTKDEFGTLVWLHIQICVCMLMRQEYIQECMQVLRFQSCKWHWILGVALFDRRTGDIFWYSRITHRIHGVAEKTLTLKMKVYCIKTIANTHKTQQTSSGLPTTLDWHYALCQTGVK